eukprot:CAMPEP_0168612670 /NCGR_PEP_ID=MMETSP0449_2-20121227/3041_1 /TAXON_ID=1082188 /ORGANISM="Strombidium rassoulzadegani, Strain ras09" /LENGTH=267 /DNA_ID=CAMNT_0008653251 /DNA_START=242 /DNA_END=1046 /DNA_ORIENTATION=-
MEGSGQLHEVSRGHRKNGEVLRVLDAEVLKFGHGQGLYGILDVERVHVEEEITEGGVNLLLDLFQGLGAQFLEVLHGLLVEEDLGLIDDSVNGLLIHLLVLDRLLVDDVDELLGEGVEGLHVLSFEISVKAGFFCLEHLGHGLLEDDAQVVGLGLHLLLELLEQLLVLDLESLLQAVLQHVAQIRVEHLVECLPVLLSSHEVLDEGEQDQAYMVEAQLSLLKHTEDLFTIESMSDLALPVEVQSDALKLKKDTLSSAETGGFSIEST